MRWWWLRIVKHNELFFLIFFLLELEYIEVETRSEELQGAHKTGGRVQGRARAPGLWPGGGPSPVDSFVNIFY